MGSVVKTFVALTVASSLLLTCATNTASAAEAGSFYFAGDLGSATYSNMDPFPNPGTVRIAIGSNFTKNLAGEIAYSKFGDSTVEGFGGSATISASAFQIAGIGSLPVSPDFDLTAKLGFSRNSAKGTSTFLASAETTNNSVMFGVGALYHLNPQFSIRVQYDNYGAFESGSNPMKASSITIGAVINP
jgi:hypothetical protein